MEIADQAISGGVDILQLRAKGWQDRQILQVGQRIKSLTQKSKTLFVLNDRADLARIIDADGVHLGQQDLPIKDARSILGKNKIIGISTHSISQIQESENESPDYIAIGPIFPTATKPDATALTPQILSQIRNKVKFPFVAVGGISARNLDQVLKTGAKRVAVCRAITEAQNVFDAISEFKQRLYVNDTVRAG